MPSEEQKERQPNQPTPEEWRRLYDAALAFRNAAPWTWMSEEDQFGIRDPESGVLYYVCITGELGEHRALALYEGAAGLGGLWGMRLEPPEDPFDMLMLQRCLSASFEDREMLDKPDLEIIKHLGLKVRGRGAWPLFRSYLPGYEPWFVTAPQARFLTLGLEQALHVARRVKTDPDLLPRRNGPGGDYLVRARSTEGADGEGWQDERDTLDLQKITAEKSKQPSITLDIARIRRLRSALPKSRSILEMDYFMSSSGVLEGSERPYFPIVILAAEQASRLLLEPGMCRTDELPQRLGDHLLTVVETLQSLPAKINVSDEQTEAWLSPVAQELGVRIARVRKLKILDSAGEQLERMLALGNAGYDLMELPDDLMELPEDLSELPEEMSLLLEEMKAALAEEAAPPQPRRLQRTARAQARPNAGPAMVYQLKVTLRGARPPIWRRIQVPGDVHLDDLHYILQAAMGWTGGHLHAFNIDGDEYGEPNPDMDGMRDESRVRLDRVATVAEARFTYEYDFGDGWNHEIRVEKILPPMPGVSLPVCLAGRRACPPEDSGGVWGYQEKLEVMANPGHPEYKEIRRWLGRSFDPEAFSCDNVNRRLKRTV